VGEEESESSALLKLISVPGLVAVAVLGVAVIALARLFGPENVLRELVMEVVASFGSTILVLAIFGLLFRTGLERLLRGAPGGEPFAQSMERLKDILQVLSEQDFKTPGTGYGAELDQIGKDLRSLADSELPALRREVAELRKLLERTERDRSS
jgi:hypothetical protein